MKKFLKITGFLTITCILSGIALSVVFHTNEEKMIANEKKAKVAAIKAIFPSSEIEEFEGYWKAGEEGFAFEGEGMGFQDKISLMIGVDRNFCLKGVVVLSCLETPGLGGKISEEEFTRQFLGKSPPFIIGENVKAITGATVSSKAFVEVLNRRIQQMKEELGDALN